jgi:hypothetical protein
MAPFHQYTHSNQYVRIDGFILVKVYQDPSLLMALNRLGGPFSAGALAARKIFVAKLDMQ